jgi:Amt family ammonium transporter
VAIGAIATFPCYYAILYRSRSGLDDSLDVAAAHGMGGMSGAILTGVFAHAVWGGSDGLLYGNPMQVVIQAVGVLATIVYCGVVTWMLLKVISLFGTLRPLQNEERTGLDILEHGEDAYGRGEGATMIPPGSTV